jgi:hypothetical protein
MERVKGYLKKAEELEKLAQATTDARLKRSYADQALTYRMLAADRRLRSVDKKGDSKR